MFFISFTYANNKNSVFYNFSNIFFEFILSSDSKDTELGLTLLNTIGTKGEVNADCISFATEVKNVSGSQKNLSPSIDNFIIRNKEPNRVYFESNDIITANNFNGFKIGNRRINSITISSGSKTGHYFTVSAPFTFWDNELIRYEGGSDLVNLEGQKLHEFTLRYILNSIEEPKTNQRYFVSVDGNDSNNGFSEETAWRTISKAGLQATFGSTVWIKAGDYGAENVIIKNNGNYLKPIKFIGYKTAIGDNPSLTRSVGMAFDSSEMPLLSGGSGAAITSKNNNYVIIRNIQIDDYLDYGIQYDNSDYTIIDNAYVNDCKWSIRTIDADATNNRIINSYVANASQTGVEVQNRNNLIKNTWAVSSYASSMDYYLTIRGGNEGKNNIIRNCYVNRFLNDSHSGHGISLKADAHMNGYSLEHNLVEDCTIINSKLELRHRSVRNNIFRNILIDGNNGININDGAAYNTLESITVKNSRYFTQFRETVENGDTNENGHHNKFINCVGDNITYLITTGVYPKTQVQQPLIQNNNWLNCTFNNITNLFTPSGNEPNVQLDSTNKITNCIFKDCRKKGSGTQNITFSYSNFYNGFAKPSGMGNFSENPLLDENYEPQALYSNLKVPRISGIYYDKNDSERSNPTTAGSIEKK